MRWSEGNDTGGDIASSHYWPSDYSLEGSPASEVQLIQVAENRESRTMEKRAWLNLYLLTLIAQGIATLPTAKSDRRPDEIMGATQGPYPIIPVHYFY